MHGLADIPDHITARVMAGLDPMGVKLL